MRKRYLFPLIYIALFGVGLFVPKLGDYLFVFLEAPVAILIHVISLLFDGPKDTMYFVFIGAIIQFFLLGYLWDRIFANQATK